jgi:hypothetical protein
VILPFFCPRAPTGKKTGEVASSGIGLQPPSMSPLIGRNIELASESLVSLISSLASGLLFIAVLFIAVWGLGPGHISWKVRPQSGHD